MRFTLDSASEVSAEEMDVHAVPGSSKLPLPAAARSPVTPRRRGILRNPSSSQSVQSILIVSDQIQSAPTSANRSQEKDETLQREMRQVDSHTPPFQRRRQRSVTPAFEMVGIPSPSSPATALSPQANKSTPNRIRSAPPWMQHSSLPRMSEIDRGFESSGNDDLDDVSSSGYSSSDPNMSTANSSEENEHDTTDSEEDAWPVDPSGTHRKTGLKVSKHVHRRTRSRVHITANDEEWDEWNRAAAQIAWERARQGVSWRTPGSGSGYPSNRSVSPTAYAQSGRLQSGPTQPRVANTHKTSSENNLDADVDEVRALLSSLDVQRKEQDKQTKDAFEIRNKALWQGIDASILAAEREAKQAAAAEARRLEAARKAQEEAEHKAKLQREQEQERMQQEKKQAEEEAAKKKVAAEEEEKRTQAAAEQELKAKAMGGSGADVRRNGEDDYRAWIGRIERIKQDVLPHISGNPELRKQCFAAKRQITPKVGQLTNSRQEIVRITQAIGSVLTAAKHASGTAGEIYTWILNHLSKCLIRQAEQEVAAKQDTAYPLARVVIWLLLEGHRDLGDVLMARLVKKCPWVLAVWPPRKPGIDEPAYRKILGYKSEDESTENYSNRMCGIFAFYVAILQTSPTDPPSGTSLDLSLIADHLRPKAMWIWCVRSLTPPAPFLGHPLAPSLWSTFLEVGGNKALNLYGRQMQKILRLMLDQGLGQKKAEFVKRESEGNVKAAMVRLELLLQAWAHDGRFIEATKGSEMES